MGKKKKYVMKKPSFWKIFAKWTSVLAVIGAFGFCGYVHMEKNSVTEYLTSYYRSWKQGISTVVDETVREMERAGDMYTAEEKEERVRLAAKRAMIAQNYNNIVDFSAVLHSMPDLSEETPPFDEALSAGAKVLCDSREGIMFMLKKRDDEVYDDWVTLDCSLDYFSEFAEDYLAECRDNYTLERWGGRYEIVNVSKEALKGMPNLYEYYVNGYTLIPSSIYCSERTKYGKEGKATNIPYAYRYDLQTENLTENLQGYIRINEDDERAKRYDGEESFLYATVVGGTKKDSFAAQCLDHTQAKLFDNGFGVECRVDEIPKNLTNLDNSMSMVIAQGLLTTWTLDGRKYHITTYGFYDFWELFQDKLIRLGGYVLTAVLLLSLLLSGMRFVRVRAVYEQEQYRRRLTDSMAHDLKTPLMAITAFSENLKENVHTEKREHYASVIVENVKYMNDIIERTLELSKTESNLRLTKEDIDVNALLDEIFVKYEEILEENEVTVEKDIGFSISGDRQLLTQAFDNLLSNAVKYTPKHGIIRITGDKKSMELANTCSSDDKAGTSDDLTQPFVKADSSRGNRSGTGLGLSIVRNIFDMHGFSLKLSQAASEFRAVIKF